MVARVAGPSKWLVFQHRGRPIRFHARKLLIAGFTGRDLEAVRHHTEELMAEGVPLPQRIPDLYLATPTQLQFGGTVWAFNGFSSGEVEYVLLMGENDVFVCIGSDHTDRELERHSIEKSKQICPKIISREAWPLRDLVAQWDELRLRSYVKEEKGWSLYQESPLGLQIRPEVLQKLPGKDAAPGTIVFSGTVPVLDGKVRYSPGFVGELLSPKDEVLATFKYAIRALEQPAPLQL
jgi:hypothetical protein